MSTTSGGTRTISPAGTGSTRNQTGFTYEELEKHRPTLVLSSVLKALDNLQSGKTNEDDEIKNNQELKEVFKAWGVKDFATRIKDLHHGKELVQFFNENKIKYATENEFKYDPEKIGENCIFRETFDSLGERSFRNLWIGFLLQMGGMQMLMIGVSFYIYEMTGSASVLGIVTSVSALPAIVLALFGGVIADRLDKKRIIQVACKT